MGLISDTGLVIDVKGSSLFEIMESDQTVDELMSLGPRVANYPWDNKLDKNLALHIAMLVGLLFESMLEMKKILDKHLFE